MHWSNILVRAPNWLGDAVMALPALRALRSQFPDAKIAILARDWVADLYRREPFCGEVLEYPGGRFRRLAAARALRRRGFDAAILFPNAFEAALAARVAGIGERVGYNRDGRSFLLTHAVAPPTRGETPPHESFYYLELLRRAGLIAELPPWKPIELHATAQLREAGEALFVQMGCRLPVVGVSPGAQNSRAKQWPAERFVEASARVARELGGSVAVFGSAREGALCRSVTERVRMAGLPVLNLAGQTTLARFLELAAACRVFLTNDSGAMHAASAAGAPTVAVFGPTEWFATSPSGPAATIVREPVECAPCMLRDCPIDHRCMTAISPDRVAAAALELVKWNCPTAS